MQKKQVPADRSNCNRPVGFTSWCHGHYYYRWRWCIISMDRELIGMRMPAHMHIYVHLAVHIHIHTCMHTHTCKITHTPILIPNKSLVPQILGLKSRRVFFLLQWNNFTVFTVHCPLVHLRSDKNVSEVCSRTWKLLNIEYSDAHTTISVTHHSMWWALFASIEQM